jgi:hypothetical protein
VPITVTSGIDPNARTNVVLTPYKYRLKISLPNMSVPRGWLISPGFRGFLTHIGGRSDCLKLLAYGSWGAIRGANKATMAKPAIIIRPKIYALDVDNFFRTWSALIEYPVPLLP